MYNAKVIEASEKRPAPPAVKEPSMALSEREIGQLQGRLFSLEERVNREAIATASALADLAHGQNEIKELIARQTGASALTGKIGAAVLAVGGAVAGGLAAHTWAK